jgi:uncharacterized protein YlbG (UPF0298 family)
MGQMNITKSAFMEMIRCRRFPALQNALKRRDFDDETNDRLMELLENSDIEIENLTEQDLEQLQTMMPYFEKIEVLAARKVLKEWKGQARYGTKKGAQKQFLRDYDNFVLMCNVDVYHQVDSQINIVEVKATTSNKFLKMTYSQNKVKYPVFYVDDNDIIHLMEKKNPALLENEKYLKQRKKLFDRFSDVGVYVYDLAFQRFVIEETKKDVKYYLGILNHEYIFDGTYVQDEPVYDDSIIRFVDLTEITKELQSEIETQLQVILRWIRLDDDSPTRLGKHCQLKKQRQCMFKDICYSQFPEKNSILHYLDRHHGFKDPNGVKHELFDLIEEGYTKMTDIPFEWLNRKNNQIQREVAITHKPYVDTSKIQAGLQEIKYPIYHLDFESFPCPLPRFKGETPYTQSLFQFSLHIERIPGVCDKEKDHIEYLSRNHNDNREELVKRLCSAIPSDGGSVMVYNQSFEKTRLKEMANIFPQYAEKLNDINNRIFDLMFLVKTNTSLFESLGFERDRAKTINYYHENLIGSYSIKKVLPIFSNLTYKGMKVGNGMEAVHAYASYPKLPKAELKELQDALVKYCQQDTWAMVEILDVLRKM